MLSQDLLSIICCPETHQDLGLVPKHVVERINTAILAGEVTERGGTVVTEPIDGGLLRADRAYIYPVRGGIPMLLIENGLPFAAFGK